MQSPPPETVRLFVALELPAEVRNSLAVLQKRLRALDRQNAMRWVSLDSTHITLKFIGDVATEVQPAIEQAVAQAAPGHTQFSLNIAGAGGFPDLRKPRVVWAGVDGNTENLFRLRDSVEKTVSPLGFPTESRPFSAHITLARARQDALPAAVSTLGEQIGKVEVGTLATWRVESISLMKSELQRSGAVYTHLFSVTLLTD